METPQPGNGFGIDQFEYTFLAIGPLDVARTAVLILKQLQQKFPQVRR